MYSYVITLTNTSTKIKKSGFKTDVEAQIAAIDFLQKSENIMKRSKYQFKTLEIIKEDE